MRRTFLYFLLLPLSANAAQTVCELLPTPAGLPLGEHSSLTAREGDFPQLATTFRYSQLPDGVSSSELTTTNELTFPKTTLSEARRLLATDKRLFSQLIGYNYPDGYSPTDAMMNCHPVEMGAITARLNKYFTQTTAIAPSAAKELLLRAQEQWLSYRATTCSAIRVAKHNSSVEEDCVISLTEARIAELLREYRIIAADQRANK